ncbi:MAG: iron-sulfur cluster assembly scaffold protein [Desulfarculus sp.]|nr:iron-sulfur cluster assembly scaffold protein [Desulfarculus sp.]
MSRDDNKQTAPVTRERITPELSDAFLTHGLTPSNLGMLPQPDGFAQPRADGSCNDVIELYLRVRDGVIIDARYMTEGCLHTVACGSALTTLIKGKSVEQAYQLEAEDIAAELGGLDPAHMHCADLALKTLRHALQDYYEKRRSPWQKLYDKT